jgi:hypothetical protein
VPGAICMGHEKHKKFPNKRLSDNRKMMYVKVRLGSEQLSIDGTESRGRVVNTPF